MFDPMRPKPAQAVRTQPVSMGRAVTWATCKAASTRTANWAKAKLEESGFTPSALALYKAPVAFDLAGHAPATGLVMRLLQKDLYRDGDFHASPTDPTPSYGRTYRNAWLAWGAQRVGSYELSQATLNRLERELHKDMWGVPENDSVPADQRTYDLGTNASVLCALLSGGRLATAEKIGGFMAGMVVHQAIESKRVLLAADAKGRLTEPADPVDVSDAGLVVFDIGAPGQVYWPLGFALRGFAQLYRATGHDTWLEPADHIAAWLGRCHEDHLTQITNAKLAWGAAELFAATGKSNWADLALKILGHILSTQNPDGVWLRPEFASIDAQPMPITLDTALERMAYLSEIPRALAMGGRPLP